MRYGAILRDVRISLGCAIVRSIHMITAARISEEHPYENYLLREAVLRRSSRCYNAEYSFGNHCEKKSRMRW